VLSEAGSGLRREVLQGAQVGESTARGGWLWGPIHSLRDSLGGLNERGGARNGDVLNKMPLWYLFVVVGRVLFRDCRVSIRATWPNPAWNKALCPSKVSELLTCWGAFRFLFCLDGPMQTVLRDVPERIC